MQHLQSCGARLCSDAHHPQGMVFSFVLQCQLEIKNMRRTKLIYTFIISSFSHQLFSCARFSRQKKSATGHHPPSFILVCTPTSTSPFLKQVMTLLSLYHFFNFFFFYFTYIRTTWFAPRRLLFQGSIMQANRTTWRKRSTKRLQTADLRRDIQRPILWWCLLGWLSVPSGFCPIVGSIRLSPKKRKRMQK